MIRRSKLFFAWLSLSIAQLSDCNLSARSHPKSAAEKEVVVEFYRLVELAVIQSSEKQIVTLQEFLRDHADFEPVYLKLLERYVSSDRIPEAMDYFHSRRDNPEYRRNSDWMLAKLFTLRHDSLAAFKAYEQALRGGAISIALLYDFIKFDHQQLGKFNGKSLLKKLALNQEAQNIISAFFHYQKDGYNETSKAFLGIPATSQRHTLVLDIWGDCHYRSSHNEQAASLWRTGLLISQQTGNLQSEAQFLANLGVLSLATRDYDQASRYCHSAYEIAQRIDDLKLLQFIEGNLGHLSYVRGDYAEASTHYKKAIALATNIKEEDTAVNWLMHQAQVFFERGNLAEALQAIDAGEAIAQKLSNNKKILLDLLNRKGIYYSFLGQREYAKKILQEAYALALELSLIEYQYHLKVKLAKLLEDEGEYERAREPYKEFINYLKRKDDPLLCAYWMGRLAATYLAEQRYDVAKKYYLQAYETAETARSKPYMAWYLLKVADVEVWEGNYNAAIQKYNSALATAMAENNQNMLWQVYLGLGNAHKKAGNLAAAIPAYTRAADIIEASRKNLTVEQLRIGYFSDRNKVYQQLAACFLQRYEQSSQVADLDSLFYFVELGRSRALQDQIRGNVNEASSAEYRQACAQLRALQRYLRLRADQLHPGEELNDLLLQLEGARYALIAQRLRAVRQDRSAGEPERPLIPSLSAVRHDLKQAGLGLLLYHISDDCSFVLIATGDNLKVARLQATPSSLAAAIDSLITPFHIFAQEAPATLPFRAALAYRLYRLLIQPTEAALPLPQRLLVVPDLALMNLPFEMLLVAPPEAAEYTPVDFPRYADHFLLHRYTMVYSPNTSFLQEWAKSTSPSPKVLIFANPFAGTFERVPKPSQLRSRTGWRFDPLPFSEAEAKKIEDDYPSVRVYRRESATKATFMREAPQQQIVHLATHAFVDTAFDAFSGLVLAPSADSTDDGILMGYEISNLNLPCDLITLSACETGRGKLVAGEGVLGLPRLFLGAGAKTVLMTLWKVDDRFASSLMPEFYDHFLNQKLPKADALAKAKRSLLSRKHSGEVYYQHPFYWASFTLYGDPGVSQGRLRLVTVIAATVILALIITFYLRNIPRNNQADAQRRA